MIEMRHEARQAVRVIRNSVADGIGAMQVAMPECVEMQDNARLFAGGVDDCGPSRRAMQRSFEASLRPLTPRQETAINLITMGKTVVATARSIKVDPATVHRWKAHNPLFAAELNRRQAALFDSMVVKLRLTMGKAVDELMALMSSPIPSKRIDTMWKLLPMIKPQRLMVPTALTEPAEIVDEEIRAERVERGEEAGVAITNVERIEQVDAEYLAVDAHRHPENMDEKSPGAIPARRDGTPRPVGDARSTGRHRSASTPTCGTHTFPTGSDERGDETNLSPGSNEETATDYRNGDGSLIDPNDAPAEAVPSVRSADHVAEEVGTRLAEREILQRRVSARIEDEAGRPGMSDRMNEDIPPRERGGMETSSTEVSL